MPPSDDKEKVDNEENEKNDMSDTKSNQSDKSDKSDKSKETPKKGKGKKDMADKMDPARFQDGGVNFKAKLIGLENVPDARGDKMCQDAMMKLKGMVKTAKAHKPKITVNVSLEGLKIIDEISQNVMHHHAVHKISFISRDIKDARAFGYIYGLGEGKHQFFGIKTDKPAETLVLTLRDLFQVVFEMKKQEVEAAKARKSAKDDEKPKDGDKTESDTEKPAAQEGAYDGGSEAPKEGGEKTIPQSNSSANLLDLENQLLNLEVTFEQVDAFSAAAPVAASAAAATTQFPVSFEQNQFGNQAMGAQRDPFTTPTLAPPPNYGTQQQQRKQPMQQQQPFPQPQPGDPFNTVPFGQSQFGAAPVQQAPVVQQQVPQPMQQPSFAAFPPQQMQSPQHAMPQMQQAPQQQPQQQQFPPQQFPPQQPPQYNAAVQQQQQQQQQQGAPQGGFAGMPVQQDPFKDDPFFTQTQGNDRYAAFTSIAPAQAPVAAPVQAMMGAPLQPMNPGGQAPASPNMNATHQSPVQVPIQDSFGDLGSLAEFKPANQYVDRTQFFKPPEQPKPSLNALAPQQQPQQQQQPQVTSQQELVRGDSTRSSRNRPRPAHTTTDPFGSDPMTDPFGSAPFTQPTASFESQEPDPFDTSAILAKTHFQGPFDTSQLRPSAAVGLSSKPQALDISASSSTPPTTRSDKIGRDTTSSNVSTPEDFSMPSPEVPPPPLPQQGMVEMPEQAPAPPPRPSFTSSSSSSSSRPGMTRQATIDVGAMSRRSGRLDMSAFTRQTTIDFTEESSASPPALPPRPPSSGPLSQPLSLPETPPPQYAPPPLPPQSTPPTSHHHQPPHFTPPSLPKHDTFQSRTLPRQKTVPSQPPPASYTMSRQSTLPAQDVPRTPPVSASSRERQWHMPGVLPQQDQFSFPPFESSTPPPFQAFKQDPFAPQSTPPGSPRLGQRGIPASRQLSRGTPPLGIRQDTFSTPPTSVRHDSLSHPSPNASPTPNISPSPSGTSVVARPRPRPRPRTPGGAQPSPTLTHVPENAKAPSANSTPPSSRSTPPLAQSTPDPFSRDGHMRHSERFPTEGFSRDAHQRQSDRTDVQAAARRVDSVKALLRTNQSEPMFSVLATETITLAPETLKEEPLDLPGLDDSKDDPFPEGVDPFVDDSPIDPFSENDPFNKDITQQVVAFRTKAIGSKDSETVKGSLSDSFVEDPFANDPFFTSGGKGTPVVSSPALSRQGRKQSRDSVRSEHSRSRTISERSTSESQHDSDPFSTVPIKRNDSASKARSDTSSVHSSTTPDPFMVDWGSGTSNNRQGVTDATTAAFPLPDTTQQIAELNQSSNLKDQSNVSSSSDLGEVMPQSKPTNGSAADVFDSTVNGVSDSDSTKTDSASLHSDPFASLDPFKFVLGSKKPDQQSSWPTFPSSSSSSVSQFRSDSPRTQSPFRDPFVVDAGLKVNGSSQLDFGGESRGGREGSVGSGSSNDNPFSSSSSQPQNGTVPVVPARQFQGNPFAAQNQWPQ